MEIKFCLGNITGRGNEVALKFKFDPKAIEQLKESLNRHRYNFQRQTNMLSWQAGGWFAEKKIWYCRQELWDVVKDELTKLGHSFVSMTRFRAKRYIQPEPQQTHSKNDHQEQTDQEKKTKSNSKSKSKTKTDKEEDNNKDSNNDNSSYKQNRKGKQERENKQKQQSNNNKSPHRINFSEKDYQILGLSSNASTAEVKQAYRDLVEVWHPDRFGHKERLRLKAEEMLKLINAAYDRIKAVA